MNDINLHEVAFGCEDFYPLFVPDLDKISWWVEDTEGIDDIYDTKCFFCEKEILGKIKVGKIGVNKLMHKVYIHHMDVHKIPIRMHKTPLYVKDESVFIKVMPFRKDGEIYFVESAVEAIYRMKKKYPKFGTENCECIQCVDIYKWNSKLDTYKEICRNSNKQYPSIDNVQTMQDATDEFGTFHTVEKLMEVNI
jgi:hypothetical protein